MAQPGVSRQSCVMRTISNRNAPVVGTCGARVDRLLWLAGQIPIARDPGPSDPDVLPIREPEPEPDTPDPEPGDQPARIEPLRTADVAVPRTLIGRA